MTTVNVISLWQPYAQLIALGHKKFETRHWQTPKRGLLAIHAAKRWTQAERDLLYQDYFIDVLPKISKSERQIELPFGKVVCICELVNVHLMTPLFIAGQTDKERAFGHWETGRYAWRLNVPKVLDTPLPLTGRQGLFKWTMPDDLAEAVEEAQQAQYDEEERRREEAEAGYMIQHGLVYTDDGGLW